MGGQTAPRATVANAAAASKATKRQVIDLTQDEQDETVSPSKKRKVLARSDGSGKSDKAPTEKRPKRWRSHAPVAYQERLARAMSQRHRNTDTDSPQEELTIAGTTGNLYTVTISAVPSCTCPDAMKGNQCKHIIYALTRILKAPAELKYQLSFLSSELRSIFANSTLPTDEISAADADTQHPNNRKAISGDCPICFCEMDDDKSKDIVWCKSACGNNVHKTCFAQWAKSSRESSGKVRCVYCRTDWEGDGPPAGPDGWQGSEQELAALKANAGISEDGYANIATSLGLSGARDHSTYHQPWVASRYRGGWGYGRRR